MYTVAGVTVFEKNEEQSAEPCLVGNALPIHLLRRNAKVDGGSVLKLALYGSKAVVLGASQDICYYKLGAIEARQERDVHCITAVKSCIKEENSGEVYEDKDCHEPQTGMPMHIPIRDCQYSAAFCGAYLDYLFDNHGVLNPIPTPT